jgi:hypothetical protein
VLTPGAVATRAEERQNARDIEFGERLFLRRGVLGDHRRRRLGLCGGPDASTQRGALGLAIRDLLLGERCVEGDAGGGARGCFGGRQVDGDVLLLRHMCGPPSGRWW